MLQCHVGYWPVIAIAVVAFDSEFAVHQRWIYSSAHREMSPCLKFGARIATEWCKHMEVIIPRAKHPRAQTLAQNSI